MSFPGSKYARRLRQGTAVAVMALTALGALSAFETPHASSASTRLSHVNAPAPTFSVGLGTCTFVDPSRPVIDFATKPYTFLSTSRTLVTEIRYPTSYVSGAPSEQRGAVPLASTTGYPTIVFAHGYDVTPDIFAPLLDAWVRAGFVVVAPLFPDEKTSEVAAQHGANTESDLVNEPADLAFVTQAVVRASNGTSSNCPIVQGLVNASELALAGHSDGATAVAMLAFDHGLDPQGVNFASLRTGLHFNAVAVFSGAEDLSQSYAAEASHPNFLIVHSRDDQCNPLGNDVTLYNSIHQPNKWFLELQRAHHLPPFDGTDRAAFRVVAATTVRFFRESLQGFAPTTSLVAYASQNPAEARMYTGALGPTFERAPKLKTVCSRT